MAADAGMQQGPSNASTSRLQMKRLRSVAVEPEPRPLLGDVVIIMVGVDEWIGELQTNEYRCEHVGITLRKVSSDATATRSIARRRRRSQRFVRTPDSDRVAIST